MSDAKTKALETLEKVKRIYDEEGGDLLTGGIHASNQRANQRNQRNHNFGKN